MAPNTRATGPSPLGREIRRQRRHRGLSVRALAQRAGVDASGLAKIERGQARTKAPPALARLARVLGVEFGSLHSAAGYERPTELPGLRPYLEIKYALPPEAIEELCPDVRVRRGATPQSIKGRRLALSVGRFR
jgi:transcriptional regulator with XRE-family HTH domain